MVIGSSFRCVEDPAEDAALDEAAAVLRQERQHVGTVSSLDLQLVPTSRKIAFSSPTGWRLEIDFHQADLTVSPARAGVKMASGAHRRGAW